MELYFAPRGILQIDNARLVFKNFRGEGGKFNKEGDRNFALLITGGSVDGREVSAEEMANALMNDLNRFGVGWNVKIKAPREEGDAPFIYLPVKVAFNDRGPQVYVESGASHRKLYEDKCTVAMEELAELQQEISKKIRGSKDKVGLLEEMADVYICLEFLKSIFNIHESDVFRAIDVKLEREEALQKGLEKKKQGGRK